VKTIVLTGDSTGLGSEIADMLLTNGYKVIGMSRTETDSVKQRKALHQEQYIHLEFDLSNTNEVKDLYIEKVKPIGPIYGLVNNAAIAYDDLATNASLERIENMFQVNVFSPMILTKYIIRDMLLSGTKGSIVNISSISASTGYKGLSMYGATKGSLESFSKGIAREWGSKGIRSNCVSPGFMETRMSSSLSVEQKERIYRRTCLRSATEERSVASTVLFLLSEDASSITSQSFVVDCGTI